MYGDSGAHPVTGFHSFNYDLRTHSPITFDALFKPGADPVAALDPIVQREMDKHWQGYGGPAPHNTLGAKTYQNFALTDDAVIFYIPQGMWLAEVAGATADLSTPVGAGVGAGLEGNARRRCLMAGLASLARSQRPRPDVPHPAAAGIAQEGRAEWVNRQV